MKKIASNILVGLTMSMAVPALADYYGSVDDDSCWDSKNSYGANCISVETEWKRDDKLHVYYTNNCDHRLYLKMCNERKSGGWDCGATGVSGNNRTTWYTYNATGKYEWISVGATKGSMDWVCAGKVSDWNSIGD